MGEDLRKISTLFDEILKENSDIEQIIQEIEVEKRKEIELIKEKEAEKRFNLIITKKRQELLKIQKELKKRIEQRNDDFIKNYLNFGIWNSDGLEKITISADYVLSENNPNTIKMTLPTNFSDMAINNNQNRYIPGRILTLTYECLLRLKKEIGIESISYLNSEDLFQFLIEFKKIDYDSSKLTSEKTIKIDELLIKEFSKDVDLYCARIIYDEKAKGILMPNIPVQDIQAEVQNIKPEKSDYDHKIKDDYEKITENHTVKEIVQETDICEDSDEQKSEYQLENPLGNLARAYKEKLKKELKKEDCLSFDDAVHFLYELDKKDPCYEMKHKSAEKNFLKESGPGSELYFSELDFAILKIDDNFYIEKKVLETIKSGEIEKVRDGSKIKKVIKYYMILKDNDDAIFFRKGAFSLEDAVLKFGLTRRIIRNYKDNKEIKTYKEKIKGVSYELYDGDDLRRISVKRN